jgi:hypothetical protein
MLVVATLQVVERKRHKLWLTTGFNLPTPSFGSVDRAEIVADLINWIG